jgi:hypothetical protein
MNQMMINRVDKDKLRQELRIELVCPIHGKQIFYPDDSLYSMYKGRIRHKDNFQLPCPIKDEQEIECSEDMTVIRR